MSSASLTAVERGSVLVERYELLRRIGVGGAGEVWRAHDNLLERDVAIKVLHPEAAGGLEARDRFRREASATARLTHPNAVVLYDIGESDGHLFLVMELVDGPTLADVLARHRSMSATTAVDLARQVAEALAAAHAAGLVHRDVKPANILLTRDGVAKVADFGIARALDAADTGIVSGAVLGTRGYLAPEQLEGMDVTPAADVYALGVIIHECVTGSRDVDVDVPDATHHLPSDLWAIVRTATMPDPADRFDDAGELQLALDEIHDADGRSLLAALSTSSPHRSSGGDDRTRTLVSRTTPLTMHAATTRVIERPSTDAPTREVDREVDRAREGWGPTATPAESSKASSHRSGWVVLGVVLSALLLAAVVGGGPSSTGGGTTATTDPPVTYAPAAATSFDPFGDGREHEGDIPAAIDGDRGTAWETEHYRTAALGGLKPGVGVVIDLGVSREVGAVELELTTPGVDVQVYALAEPPGADPATWGSPVANVQEAPPSGRMSVDGAQGRYWLLWFKKLVPAGGGHQAGIAEVRFLR